jgi:hypothetical protein
VTRLRLVVCALLIAAAAWPQGYRLESDRVAVDESDWAEWEVAAGTVQFGSEGVRPHLIRAQINAALDAPDFVYDEDVQGGVRAAGVNLTEAANVIDGQENTFWEPNLDAPLRDWWVEIDLGRLVWARKIVVKFAPEGMGDPFLQFKVLTSNGLPAFSQSKALRFAQAGRSEGLNKTQRVFEFDLKPSQEADTGFVGDMFQFVQIVATASARGQGHEVSAARWNSLPEEERGDVLYFLRESSGILRQIDQAQHAELSESRAGPIQYYRRERPRLVEVEVWTEGDNISLGALSRGGLIGGTSNTGTERLAVDGDYKTVWTEQVGVSGGEHIDVEFDRELLFDLGTWFWISRAVISFDRENIAHGFTGAFPNYVINLSNGQRNPDGSLAYVGLSARETADQEPGRFSGLFPHIFYQDNAFPLTKARYFKMDYRVLMVPSWANSGIRELQLYGHGFLPQVTLQSAPMELGSDPRILSSIHWAADAPPGTQVQFRTRTGNQLNEEIHYFTTAGKEVTEAKYRKLLSFQRGDSTVSVVPGTDWSSWSPFYTATAAPITSPSPRRYTIVEATLRSDDPSQAVLLRRLHIALDWPLASQVLGEVQPRQTQQRGERTVFTLSLQPQFQAGNRGFDQVLMVLPPGAAVDLEEVVVGAERERYGPEEVTRIETGTDSLWVRLPVPVTEEEGFVALQFSGVLYLASNAFAVQIGLGEGDERVWQRVDSGAGRSLQVLTPLSGGLLGEVVASSNPFTPNGDGINDVVELVFPVFAVQGTKALVLEVYGLDGQRVRQMAPVVAHAAGVQRLTWDGRDDQGRLTPPGLYLCRVGVKVDAEGEQTMITKLVASAY